MAMDVERLREDFPALRDTIYKEVPLVYLDNAATTQRPQCVIDRLAEGYLHANANIHRGVHYLSRVATEAHEAARETAAHFIHAREAAEVVFTRGTTDGINTVADTYCRAFMQPGDEVIVSTMEHHSNIVPWQLQGAKLRVIPISDEGELDMEAYEKLFSPRTKMVAVTALSNVLGTVNPVREIVDIAHAHGVPCLIDAAQAIAHRPVDVQAWDCDFLTFSGHKIYGPTGIGVLYGKREWLERIPPYQGGGEMIDHVSFDHTTYADLPYKFEAGTPDFIGSLGLESALKYVSEIGIDEIQSHERELIDYCTSEMEQIEGMRIYGTAPGKESVISFLVDGVHPYDLGTLLDHLGIALRTGHHCAQPLMERYGITGTARVSFALYTTREEVDTFIAGLRRVLPMLR
ncbi:MAG: cysteine desulfurase [Porphyromonas sp.]|uniref:aminotransferase class V-fold PLP-dependent enzyme n=1 Tax=Porphyromonas sp. TaxID=1924944 RepID=UPI002A918BD7|nr:cysteine desulfurase [Porphyromonas sp.]MDD7468509.1 cysteine desulfurase [Bacteroidales bacterium]MDY6101883.1 cysteine desulfurase [Porphyromonas sp.]